MTYRDLYLGIRAQNLASGVIRQVGRDYRMQMQRISALDLQRRQAASQLGAMRGRRQLLVDQRSRLRNLGEESRIHEQIAANRAQIAEFEKAAPTFVAAGGDITALRANQAALVAENEKLAGTLSGVQYKFARLDQQLVTTNEMIDLQAAKVARLDAAWAEARGPGMFLAQMRRIEHLGRTIMLGGAVGTLTMGLMARQAADFGTQTMLAATQRRPLGAPATATLKINAQLQKIILDQMKQFPAAGQDMSQVLYEIFSGTNITNMKRATDMLTNINKAAVAGQVPLATMGDALLTIYNNFPNAVKSSTEALDRFFAAVRYARANPEQLAQSLSYVVPIAKEAGLSLTDVYDALGLLSRQTGGRVLRRDAQGLAQLMQLFARPEVMRGLQKYGVQVEDLTTGKMRPFRAILRDIHDRLVATGKFRPGPELLNFFKTISAAGGAGTGARGLSGTIQARRIFAFLLEHMQQYHTVSGQINRDTDEFRKSWEAMRQAPGVQWQIFLNNLKAMVIVLGQGAIPAFITIGQYVKNAVDWFERLSEGTRKTIGYFVAIGSIAALIGGAILMIGGAIAAFVVNMRLLRGEAGGAGILGMLGLGRGGLAAETGAITARGGLTLGLAAAIPLMIRYHTQTAAVVRELGGLSSILGVVTVLIGVRMVRALMLASQELILATSRAEMFRLSLALIPRIIAIAVVFTFGRKDVESAIDTVTRHVGNAFVDSANFITKHSPFPWGKKTLPHIASAAEMERYRREVSDLKKLGYEPGGRPILGLVNTDELHRVDQLWKTNLGGMTKAERQAAITRANRARDAKDAKNQATDFWTTMDSEHRKNQTRSVVFDKRGEARWEAAQRRAAAMGVSNTARFTKLFNAYLAAEKYAKAHPTDYQAQLKAANAYSALQANASKQQLEAARKVAAAQLKGAKDAAGVTDQAANDYAQKIDQSTSTLEGVYQNFLQLNQQSFGTIFQMPTRTPLERVQNEILQMKVDWNIPLNTQDLTRIQDAQLRHFRDWRRTLGTLAKEVPHDLLASIEAQGEDAQPFAEAITRMSPKDRAHYIRMWKEGQHQIQIAARQDFSREMGHWKALGRGIVNNMLQGMDEQSAKIHTWVKALAKSMLKDVGVTLESERKKVERKKGVQPKDQTTKQTTVHMNVHAHQHESLDHVMKKATFNLRNRLPF